MSVGVTQAVDMTPVKQRREWHHDTKDGSSARGRADNRPLPAQNATQAASRVLDVLSRDVGGAVTRCQDDGEAGLVG